MHIALQCSISHFRKIFICLCISRHWKELISFQCYSIFLPRGVGDGPGLDERELGILQLYDERNFRHPHAEFSRSGQTPILHLLRGMEESIYGRSRNKLMAFHHQGVSTPRCISPGSHKFDSPVYSLPGIRDFPGLVNTGYNRHPGVFITRESKIWLSGEFITQESELPGAFTTEESRLPGVFTTAESRLPGVFTAEELFLMLWIVLRACHGL